MIAEARPTVDQRIAAALWFAERGFGVFSVWSVDDAGYCRCPNGADCAAKGGTPGKHPVTRNGFHDATTDPVRIRAMLDTKHEPNYGLVPPPGVFIWDVDDDGDGIGRLARLQELYGPLPPTLRTETRNGQHIILRWPDGYPRPIGKMFGYVTRWGEGKAAGYVVGPRSVHPSGFVYAPMVGSFEIATLPDVWAKAAVEGEKAADTKFVIGGALPERGGRHDWLRDKARYYRGVIADPAVLRVTLLAENARLDEPKTEAEVDRAIGDVYRNFPPDDPVAVEEKITRKLEGDELDMLGLPSHSEFPQPPADAAFGGTIGQLVDDIAGGTDASRVGLLGAMLAFCSALIPGSAYFHRDHTTSPFIALVGESSVGRKGTAMYRVLDAWGDAVGLDTVNRHLLDGVNSGEGLISAMQRQRDFLGSDPTVGLIFEEEYATLISSRGRDGSTLDPRMRAAFDGSTLSNRKANETKSVQPPYWLPALAAITPTELRQRLEAGAMQSGSANRWLYLPVVRRQMDATNERPVFEQDRREELQETRRDALRRRPNLPLDSAARSLLNDYSEHVATVSVGLATDLTKRYGVIALRVALTHAMVDRHPAILTTHVDRAIALLEYARLGIPWTFGATIGNRDASLLYRHLVETGRLSTHAITQQVIRDPIRRQDAIDELIRIGRARIVTVETRGRNRTELVPVEQDDRPFVPFVHYSSVQQERDAENLHGMHGMHGSAQDARTEGARKVHGRGSDLHERVICEDYAAHQSSHRYTPDGWICDICEGRKVDKSDQ